MGNNQASILTIGHSNHETSFFLKLLVSEGVQIVVDVRSAPYSKYVSQFNKSEIESTLVRNGLKYLFMGDLIGGKPNDTFFYEDGRVSYEKIAQSEKFNQGIQRLLIGIRDGWKIILMCAEEDPLCCHRHQLIAKKLELKQDIQVFHIRKDGSRIRAKDFILGQIEQFKLF